jgi:hypothetical protein
VLFSQPDLPERRSAVRPEVFSPQPHSSLNILFANKRSFISNVMRAKHPTFAALMKAAACRVDKGNFHA